MNLPFLSQPSISKTRRVAIKYCQKEKKELSKRNRLPPAQKWLNSIFIKMFQAVAIAPMMKKGRAKTQKLMEYLKSSIA
jgi:hypothetical protein